jgi:hypothetical protein
MPSKTVNVSSIRGEYAETGRADKPTLRKVFQYRFDRKNKKKPGHGFGGNGFRMFVAGCKKLLGCTTLYFARSGHATFVPEPFISSGLSQCTGWLSSACRWLQASEPPAACCRLVTIHDFRFFYQ